MDLDDIKPKSLRQRARRLEKAALARVTGGQDLLQFQQDLLALLHNPTGRRLLSSICANLTVAVNSEKVVQNFKEIYNVMKDEKEGSTKKKNSSKAGAVVSAFGAGTTYVFLEEVLGIEKGLARKWQSNAKKTGKLPDFFLEKYPAGVTRSGMLDEIKEALVIFFLSETYIESGAKLPARHLKIGAAATTVCFLP